MTSVEMQATTEPSGYRPQEFLPPRYLRNGHIQSMLASLGLRRPYVDRCSQQVVTAAQETILELPKDVRLHSLVSMNPNNNTRKMAILIHGWEGSADSMYLRSLSGFLYGHGFDVVRLHLRDHGPSHKLNVGLFHSCRLEEAVDAVAEIHRLYPDRRLFLAGFSLGGNFSLRIAANTDPARVPLERVFAVCPVLDPTQTMDHLNNGFVGYNWYFLRKWRRSLRQKESLFPEEYEFGDIDKMSLWELTEHCICRYSEFTDTASYLQGYAIVGDRLQNLRIPSRVMLAQDDPIIPAKDANRLAKPSALDLNITQFGGHCGYIERLDGPSFADKAIAEYFLSA